MDLNMMMREQARNGLQAQLDAAVTNGDTEAARKVAKDIAALEVSAAPKAAPYGNDEIKAELSKLDWFGVDPKKSARVIELGKHMDPKKFATAELFAAALVKAVEDDGKPLTFKEDVGAEDDGEDDTDGDKGKAAAAKPKRTDGPGEADATQRTVRRTTSGPWTKLADAPADIQKEIRRSADKFVPAKATKEQREGYIARALESQYLMHQRKAEKK